MIYKDSVFSSGIDRFDATFTPDAVTYRNNLSVCVQYDVRIDFKLEKTFAIRRRLKDSPNPMCAKLEPRIEMQLVNGMDASDYSLGNHFVPVIQILGVAAKAL